MTEIKNSIKQQMFDYLKHNHKELFQSDKTATDVNSEILNAFYPNLTDVKDKRGKLKLVGSYKNEYLKIYTQSQQLTSQVQELITDDKSQQLTSQDNCDKSQQLYDVSSVMMLIQDLQDKMTLQQQQITELQSKYNAIDNRTASNTVITEIIKDDISNLDKTRYTLYITNTNVEYIKAFSKQNHNVSITALLNYLLNHFRTNNTLIDDKTQEPTQAKSLFF